MRTGEMMRLATRCGLVMLCAGLGSVSAWADLIVYNTIPGTLPPDFAASVGYEAYGASEFGGVVTPSVSGGALTSATVAMSNWATAAEYASYAADNAVGYDVSLTLTLYDVGSSNATGAVPGSVIDSETVDALINWRTPSTGCTSPDGSNDGYQIGGSGPCYGGDVQLVSFGFPSVVLPADFIWGLSFNTQDYGTDPTGVAGPYNSLNVGLTLDPASVGTNPALDPSSPYYDSAYWTAASGSGDYGTSGIVGSFSQDTGWISSGSGSGAIEFESSSTPEPGTFGLIGLGFLSLLVVARKKLATN